MQPQFDIRQLIRQRLSRSVELKPHIKRKPRELVSGQSQDVKSLHASYKEYSASIIKTQHTEPSNKEESKQQAPKTQARVVSRNRRSTVNTNDFARYFDGKKSLMYHNNSTLLYKLEIRGEPTPFAIKVLLIDGYMMARELYYLKQLNHPNIIQLKHYFITKLKVFTLHYLDQSGKMSLHMIFPYISHTLREVLDRFPHRPLVSNPYRPNTLPKILYKLYIYQLIRGVAYLHSKNIMHRDLHPSNILVDMDSLQLKICDFNSAKPLANGEENAFYIGSREYRAPELLLGSTSYNQGIDIWAMGCMMVEIYHGIRLFQGKNNNDVLADIIKVLGVPTREELVAMDSPVMNLKIPPIKTISYEQRFKEYSYGDGFNDLISKILVYKPSQRMSAFECLMHPFFQEIKHPSVRINHSSLPNLFNFTDEEMQVPLYKNNMYRLVPEWYKLKRKRNQYLQTNFEDAVSII